MGVTSFHDVFEGLSCHAMAGSVGLQVLDNVIQDASDNAIEFFKKRTEKI